MNWWLVLASAFVWGLIYTAWDSVVDRLADGCSRRKK